MVERKPPQRNNKWNLLDQGTLLIESRLVGSDSGASWMTGNPEVLANADTTSATATKLMSFAGLQTFER
jgi:hypothetical protein